MQKLFAFFVIVLLCGYTFAQTSTNLDQSGRLIPPIFGNQMLVLLMLMVQQALLLIRLLELQMM